MAVTVTRVEANNAADFRTAILNLVSASANVAAVEVVPIPRPDGTWTALVLK